MLGNSWRGSEGPALHGSHSAAIYPQFCKRWRARRPLHWYRQHVKSWLMDHISQRFCEMPTAAARGPSSFCSSVNSLTTSKRNKWQPMFPFSISQTVMQQPNEKPPVRLPKQFLPPLFKPEFSVGGTNQNREVHGTGANSHQIWRAKEDSVMPLRLPECQGGPNFQHQS